MTTEVAAGTDSVTRPDQRRERVITALSRLALVGGVVYLGWRATTMSGTHLPTAVVLLAAEVLGLVVFAARVGAARRPPMTPIDAPDAPRPEVGVVVSATDATPEAVRTTLLSLRRVEGIGRIQVVDTASSRWVRSVAERLSATVLDAEVGVEQAVATTPEPWVLVLDAGDLPTPDLVVMAAPACSAPDVGIVQLGHEEADPTTFEQDLNGRWSLDPFEQQVVRPSLAAHGSIPWYGDGPALLRRAVLAQVGDWQPGASTWATGVRVIQGGFRVTHIPLTLARVPATSGFGDGLSRRRRRLEPAVRTVLDGSLRRLPRPARVAHLLGAVPVLGALQRLLLAVAFVSVLVGANVPLSAPGSHIVAFAGAAYVLRWSAQLLMGRGRLSRLAVLRAELKSLGVDLTPFVSWSATGARRVGAGALGSIIVAIDIAVVAAAWSVWRDESNGLPGEVAAIALVLAAVFVGVAMEALVDAAVRHQRRRNRRVRLGLVTCRVEEHDGQLADLSTSGAGVVLPSTAAEAPETGIVTTVSFRIPDADGAWRAVTTLARVAYRIAEPDGTVRLGLEFDDPSVAPLDPVVEFLTIDRRLVAMGRRRLTPSGDKNPF